MEKWTDVVWRCTEDKRRKKTGKCDFDCCNHCMEKYTVSLTLIKQNGIA